MINVSSAQKPGKIMQEKRLISANTKSDKVTTSSSSELVDTLSGPAAGPAVDPVIARNVVEGSYCIEAQPVTNKLAEAVTSVDEKAEIEPTKREWKYDPAVVIMENTDWVESEKTQLDKYHSDINMVIKADGVNCFPLSKFGFAYMWAGARANYGVSLPCSVLFQTKITGAIAVNIKGNPFGSNHMARIGWSISGQDFQLGETPYSFGYQSDGRCCCDSQFVDYGEPFGVGDIITSYLTLNDDMVTISFSKNGEPAKQAYQLESHLLGLNSLYPHVASKNMALCVNFGFVKRAWVPVDKDYKWIGRLPIEARDRATKPPLKKSDCEVLLMIGMIGAGKSHWIAKKVEMEPEKHWNVIGLPEMLQKMKVEGVETSQCYNGRWDDLCDVTNTGLKKLLPVAATKFRNYIIDQTNVYEGAQSRKMRPFKGFKRKAVVVLPPDEVYRERLEKLKNTQKRRVHEDAILEMKANFHIPVAGRREGLDYSFDEVIYTEGNAADAAKLIEEYNIQGQKKFKRISKQYHKRDEKVKLRAVDMINKKQHKAERANRKRHQGFGTQGPSYGPNNFNTGTGNSTDSFEMAWTQPTGTDDAVRQAVLQVNAEAQSDTMWRVGGVRGIRSAPPRNWGGIMHESVRGNPRVVGTQGWQPMGIPRAYNRMGMPIGYPRTRQPNSGRGIRIQGNQMGIQLYQMGMQSNRMGMPSNRMGMQGNQMGMHGNQMGMQANQMGMQANQTGMRRNQIRMQKSPLVGQENQVGMQGNQVGMQGNQMDMKGNKMIMQGYQVGPPGNKMGTQLTRMGMQDNLIGMQENQTGMQETYKKKQQSQMNIQGNQIVMPGTQTGVESGAMGLQETREGLQKLEEQMQVDTMKSGSPIQHIWSEMQQTMTQTMAENMQYSMLQAFQQQMETAVGSKDNWHYEAGTTASWQTNESQGLTGYDDSLKQQQSAAQQGMAAYGPSYGSYG
ncbi:heterogeneous nuclear ribonucleoprotein U-like isoform X2 [Watersipora subatra]|uniref:heterogeneous nuclear ribonucleoprotein U-like isoform X2 n=1 Tax=Watersipora subatra TaxID=2589382 RepID=UPI00355C4063